MLTHTEIKLKSCPYCKEEQPDDLKHYEPRSQQCRRCHNEKNRMSGKKDEEFILKLKLGAKCSKCNYDGPPETLEFAYKNHKDKHRRRGSNKATPPGTMSRIMLEAALPKLHLLCAYCRRLDTKAANHGKPRAMSLNAKRCQKERESRLETVNREKLRRQQCTTCKRQVSVDNLCAFDFDHIDRSNKIAGVGEMANRRCYTVEDIELEMRKCQLLCACCHAVKSCAERRQKDRPKTVDINSISKNNVITIVTKTETTTTTTITSTEIDSDHTAVSTKRARSVDSVLDLANSMNPVSIMR